jgi:uncharacterized protein
MNLTTSILLCLAACLAGALNSVAGGGSFISFPSLIFIHVPPIPANATSTVALWPGSVASTTAYWKRLPADKALLISLTATSGLGGVVGAKILLHTPQELFLRFVPFLFIGATLLLIFGRKLAAGLGKVIKTEDQPRWLVLTAANLAQFFIATYGGFFGGGIGILMLALFTLVAHTDMHGMNAVKTMLATVINASAIVTFIFAKAIFWPEALVMVGGAIAGGFGGAHYAQKLHPERVRSFAICIGIAMSVYFFWKY